MMADNGIYLHAYEIVIETIARLTNLIDIFEIDGLVLRLECLNRLLVSNTDPNTQTAGIIALINDAINSLMRVSESHISHDTDDMDDIEFVPAVYNHNRG